MNILEVRGLQKDFEGLRAVHNVSFELKKNEILGIIGPNGAGKTTLFNLISGFLRPTKGTIYFDGMAIHQLQPHRICKLGIARTFQIVQTFPDLTVLECVMAGAFLKTPNRHMAKSKALEIIDKIHLRHKADFQPGDLTIEDLKHLEIAKALATGPKVILVDEIMSGLTPTEMNDSIEMLRDINRKGISLLVIEHAMQVIMRLCHRIIVLHHGELIASGSPDEITKNERVIEAYLGEEYYLA